MGRSQETFNKKEGKKKKAQKKQEKAEKMADRKSNNTKGKSLDDMMAYVDEMGNITATPPDPRNRKKITLEEIQIGVPKYEHNANDGLRTGIITNFNDAKGFGFIRDTQFQEDVFVHISSLTEPLKQGDKVSFSTEKGPRGLAAVNVKKAV